MYGRARSSANGAVSGVSHRGSAATSSVNAGTAFAEGGAPIGRGEAGHGFTDVQGVRTERTAGLLTGAARPRAPAVRGNRPVRRADRAVRTGPARVMPVRAQASAASTAACACSLVVGNTGTGLSPGPISSSISVQPRTTPSAPAATSSPMTSW